MKKNIPRTASNGSARRERTGCYGLLLVFIFVLNSVFAQKPHEKDDDRTIQVPIVFHVIHASDKDSVSRETLLKELQHLNLDYSARNDTSFMEDNMRARMGNPNIEFVLLDSTFTNGSQGIKYVRSLLPVGKYPRLFSPLIDSANCLNIYVYNMNGASTPVPGRYVRINFQYMGSGTHTLTHEIGHAFGLWHPWGKTNCSLVKSFGAKLINRGSDNISDTPSQFTCSDKDWKHTDCPVTEPKIKRRNYNNFMDYGACRCMFTKGQVHVMRASIIDNYPTAFSNSSSAE